jgi:hypothetical protein
MAASADDLEVLVVFGADNGTTASDLEVLVVVEEATSEPEEQPKFVCVNT